MKIFLAADHRGFELKEALKPWLQSLGHTLEDCGNTQLDPADDYVDFTRRAVKKLLLEYSTRSVSPAAPSTATPSPDHSAPLLSATAIGICGSGIGVSIAANRSLHIRCALCMSPAHAAHARRNDHANMLALASEYVSLDQAQAIVIAFLTTEESQTEKYNRRTIKLDAL